MNRDELREPARRFAELRALTPDVPTRLASAAPVVTVVGDVILDGWWSGVIERMCREAPAPVVEISRRDYAPGGAANTAMNLAALGASVRMVGLIGQDFAGRCLTDLLEGAGVDTSGLVVHEGITTTTKYRISSADQVMLRLDETGGQHPAEALELLADAVRRQLPGSDAVVICDYGTGALDDGVRDALRDASEGPRDVLRGATPGGPPQVPLTVVDAHDPQPWADMGPDLVTPNAQEAAAVLGLKLGAGPERAEAVMAHRAELLAATGAKTAVVTLDRDGTVVLPEGGRTHRTWARPAAEKQASGAGDTFVAALTLARACGLPMTTAVDLAQAAADVVVHRGGTSVCSTADLAAHLGSFSRQALDASELVRRIAAERAVGRRIVLTNGCFDVLHRGHTSYLNQAKQLGDVLVVALNSDDSVRRLKGPGRPINPAADRAGVLAALSCVDYVTVFDTDTPIPLIEALRPDIYAKGGDYTPQMLEESAVVETCGGRVEILDYIPEQSTTAVVERIRAAGSP